MVKFEPNTNTSIQNNAFQNIVCTISGNSLCPIVRAEVIHPVVIIGKASARKMSEHNNQLGIISIQWNIFNTIYHNRYHTYCDNDKFRIQIKLWTHKGHPVLRPQWWPMWCIVYVFCREIIVVRMYGFGDVLLCKTPRSIASPSAHLVISKHWVFAVSIDV